MKFKHFVPPFVQHDPTALDAGEITELKQIFERPFVVWYYTQKDVKPIVGFSFMKNETVPTSTIKNPPTHLVNVDMSGGRSYVIGHLWLTDDEAIKFGWELETKYALADVYTGEEPMFQPKQQPLEAITDESNQDD